MSSLRVVSAGTFTTVQDLGRPGHCGFGVAASGALDPDSLRLANRLVGNDEDAAGLELTFGGLVLQARGGCVVAIAGAPVSITIEHGAQRRSHGPGAAVHVPDGALLSIGPPSSGLRSWLAVRGGLQTARVLGSASTDVLAGLNEALADGDELPVGPAPASDLPMIDHAPQSTPSDAELVLRVVLGPRHDWFEDPARAVVGPWTVDARSNRVGVRLEGLPLRRDVEHEGRELSSEGAVAGAVQVASNGLPVLFLADHPVTAGYPVIACVVTADLPRAAQAAPGQSIRLHPVPGPNLT